MVNRKTCPKCFKLIKDPCRIKIIQKLKKSSNNVTKILSEFSLTQPTISYHLRVLEKNGILYNKKKGREVFYFLNKKYPCKNCFLFEIPFKV